MAVGWLYVMARYPIFLITLRVPLGRSLTSLRLVLAKWN